MLSILVAHFQLWYNWPDKMSILTGEGLAKYYGAQDVFSGVSFQISRGDKIALIGANGAGKTTLLRIIAGLESPSAGTVRMAKGLRVGYLSQKQEIYSARTVYDEMRHVFAHLQAQQARLHELEHQMAHPDTREQAMDRYGKLLQEFELAGGYTYEQKIRRVLLGLGFMPDGWSKPLRLLSGGQRTRAQLARLLLEDPELLLLDEPTNYLDLTALEWLEEYLVQWPGTLLIVSHDRYFVDKVAGRVWELEFGRMEQYVGNYRAYAMQRMERWAQRRAEYEAQQAYIERTEEFIRRYKAGQRAKEAKGRQKRLERIDRLDRPHEQKTINFALSTKLRGGNDVLTARNLQVGYARPLVTCRGLLLRRHDRAALIGPNGSGKTSFLRTILGELAPLAGEFKIGSNIRIAYLAQGYETLRDESTVLDEVLRVKELKLQDARNFLGRFLFSGDDVYKPINCLSGGERGRVALAMLSLQGANLLLLDEPTNHLDIQSQEFLQQVLEDFDGTILFVSHDRYFINALATQVWALEGSELTVYDGGYSEYLAQVQARQAEAKDADREEKPRPTLRSGGMQERRLRKQQEQRQAELEAEIESLEARLAGIRNDLEVASASQQIERVYELGVEYENLQQQLQSRWDEWAAIAECEGETLRHRSDG